MTVHLSRLARQDLDAIRDYTLEVWGREQWLIYFRGLAEAFEQIAAHPEKGRKRDLFYPGMRSVTYRQHIIFYAPIKANDGKPVILRILHQKRNLPALVYYEDLED